MPEEQELDHTDRATADWDALASRCIKRTRSGHLLVREGVARAAPLWPTSQVISAALTRFAVEQSQDAAIAVAELDAGLRRFETNSYYCESRTPGTKAVYYDDNAWIALNLLTTALLQHRGLLPGDSQQSAARARNLLSLLRSGEDPKSGGVRWKVGGDTLNACSTAPAGIVAARVVEVERLVGSDAIDHAELIDFAGRCAVFLAALGNSEGLIADHLRSDGSVEPSVYSYNQGTAAGLSLQLARIGNVDSDLSRAFDVANASVEYYGNGDRLWAESPAFIAIYLRHLRLLRAHTGAPVGAELEQVWLARLDTARDGRTGFYSGNGIGSYDGSVSLDQAGITCARYLAAMPDAVVTSMC